MIAEFGVVDSPRQDCAQEESSTSSSTAIFKLTEDELREEFDICIHDVNTDSQRQKDTNVSSEMKLFDMHASGSTKRNKSITSHRHLRRSHLMDNDDEYNLSKPEKQLKEKPPTSRRQKREQLMRTLPKPELLPPPSLEVYSDPNKTVQFI